MLKNVINLGAAPSCASDLKKAFQIICLNEPATQPFCFGRAILSGHGKEAESRFSSIIMLRNGILAIRDSNGAELTLSKGEVAHLPAGTFSWDAKSADCVILVLHRDNPQLSLAKLDLDYPMSPGGAPKAELLNTPAPQTARHEFQSENSLSWGTWATTPYARRPITYSFSELMLLRKGEVTLSNPDEGSATFAAGDIFLVCPGAVAAWSNPVDLEKFWVIRATG